MWRCFNLPSKLCGTILRHYIIEHTMMSVFLPHIAFKGSMNSFKAIIRGSRDARRPKVALPLAPDNGDSRGSRVSRFANRDLCCFISFFLDICGLFLFSLNIVIFYFDRILQQPLAQHSSTSSYIQALRRLHYHHHQTARSNSAFKVCDPWNPFPLDLSIQWQQFNMAKGKKNRKDANEDR